MREWEKGLNAGGVAPCQSRILLKALAIVIGLVLGRGAMEIGLRVKARFTSSGSTTSR